MNDEALLKCEKSSKRVTLWSGFGDLSIRVFQLCRPLRFSIRLATAPVAVPDCIWESGQLTIVDLGTGRGCFVSGAGGLGDGCFVNLFNRQCQFLNATVTVIAKNLASPNPYQPPNFQKYFDRIGIGSVQRLGAPLLHSSPCPFTESVVWAFLFPSPTHADPRNSAD